MQNTEQRVNAYSDITQQETHDLLCLCAECVVCACPKHLYRHILCKSCLAACREDQTRSGGANMMLPDVTSTFVRDIWQYHRILVIKQTSCSGG